METRTRQSFAVKKQSRLGERNGIASLEFVMGVPFLMLVMACIYTLAYAGVSKTDMVCQVRHQVWSMREKHRSHNLQNYKRIEDTKPMQIAAGTSEKDMPGEISGIRSGSWSTYSWLGSHTSRSGTMIITGTWDHKEITEFNSPGPHISVLERPGSIQGLGLLAALDRIISFAL